MLCSANKSARENLMPSIDRVVRLILQLRPVTRGENANLPLYLQGLNLKLPIVQIFLEIQMRCQVGDHPWLRPTLLASIKHKIILQHR